MKSKTFVLMFLAIGCGLVAAYLTARITAKQANPDTVTVLVAKEKIKAGDLIKEPDKMFAEMQYPLGSTPNAISNYDDLKNKMVNKTVHPGQWLTPDDLSSNFGIELPKGYYAMSVKVSPETGASGFILPKSHVNVVATIRPNGGMGRPKVVTVLQDVLVLAVDTISSRPEDKMALPALSTALLAVKPADSQKITLAQSMGELRLVLRGNDDEVKQVLPPLEELTGDFGGSERQNEPAAPAPTYRLAVAKQDIEAGAVIDDPAQLFEVKTFSAVPEKAIPAEELAALKGKTLKAPLFKDGVLTTKHFDEKLAVAAVKTKAEPKKHLMFIQNGGNRPEVVTFLDGIAAGFGSTPAAEAIGSPAAKDEETTPDESSKDAGK
jgi:pilus assembly protein CpaB